MITREQTRKNYDRMSRWYDLFASSEKKFTDIGIELLAIKSDEYVLEIGFGTGHALAILAHQVGSSGLATGIDLSPGMISVTRKRIEKYQALPVNMVQGDATQPPYINKSFDAIFISFTIELFDDNEILVVLNECFQMLKPDGRLCVVNLSKKDVFACKLYEWGHQRWPSLLDCRPIELQDYLKAGRFRAQATKSLFMWGLPVNITLCNPIK